MEGPLVACPVCTLYLREGMSMHVHLNTHPKDQVIEALVRLYTQEQPLNLQQLPSNVPPGPLINPFQVVSEEHIFLGRQQVTNIIHAPLMSYPIYSQPQVLGPSPNEFISQADIGRPELIGVNPHPAEPIVTALVNVPEKDYSTNHLQNSGDAVEEAEEDQDKCFIEMPNQDSSPASVQSGLSVRTDLTNQDQPEPEPCGEYITSDCDFQDEDARHSEDLIHSNEYAEEMVQKCDDKQIILESELERSSSGLNIQADECMPARGELSGHGSMGDPGTHTVWVSDEPMIQIPGPLWKAAKDLKKKYFCLYCEEEFKCPKERRVHVATLHCNQDTKQEIKKVMCTKCGLQLSSQRELKVHTRAEHKKISRQCGVCMEEFPTHELYMEHIIKIHPLECRTCGKTFHSKSSLHTHAKIHLVLKPHACSMCPKSFITNQKLKEHMNGHTGFAPIQCNLCDRRFKRYSNLKQHKDSAHFQIKKKVKEYFCECGETFVTKKKLEWHRETHDDKPKQCMYCSERYIHNVSLTRHIRKAHNREYIPDGEDIKKKNVNCPICNQIFIETSLRAHMKQHGSVKQFGCIVCGKKFLTKWNLHLHRWTHASRISKPYKCTMCKGAFIRQSDLQAHTRAHYGYKPFTCNHCGMQFNRKHNWLRHEKEHNSEKKYTCDECGKTFHRNYYLVDHLRIHTGVKPYSCHICNKTSSTKSTHNKHIKTHHAREAINTES